MNSILVLLATYNGKPWLVEQVKTVLDQTGVEIQVTIGDDCSTDSAVDDLENCIIDPRLHIKRFSTRAGGAGQSFLRLLSNVDTSTFDFVAFCDQDDLWYSDKLLRASRVLLHERADGYSSAVRAFWPDGKERLLTQNENNTDLDFLFEGAGQGCTFVLRSDFAQQIKNFVIEHQSLVLPIYYHDWLIYAISRALNKKWAFDSEPSMHYRQHENNDTGARGAVGGIKKRVQLISEGWYAGQVGSIIEAVSCLNKRVIPGDFMKVWSLPHCLRRRISLACVLLSKGRRRLSDRVVLSLSALMGWI